MQDFAPTWIGGNPFDTGFVIGSRNGVLAFTNEQGSEIAERQDVSVSKSAINGIDGLNRYLAVTTSNEISVFGFPEKEGEKVRSSRINHGAHTIIATTGGKFLAPLGPRGLGIITPDYDQAISFRVIAFKHEPVFYRIAEMPPVGERSYFICACRDYGVGFIDWVHSDDDPGFQVGKFQGADVIDVIAIPTPDHPHAIAAVGTNGELFLCRDAVNQEPPITLHYDKLCGTVYRILASHGHLILMTGKAFYVLANLGKRLVQPVFDDSDSPVMTVPVDAIDAYVHENRWLMVITPKGIQKYDIKKIDAKFKAFGSPPKSTAKRPTPKVKGRAEHYVTAFLIARHKILRTSKAFHFSSIRKTGMPKTGSANFRLSTPTKAPSLLMPYRFVRNTLAIQHSQK